MKYARFEELPVWQAAMNLAERVYSLTEDGGWSGKGDLRNQLQRAALSISNNVAEGFERGSTQELITFIYIARGSAGEVRSMLILAERLASLAHLKSHISNLKSQSENVARQLRAWAESLQNSSIKGQRYLTAEVKRVEERKRTKAAFWAQLRQIREGATKGASGGAKLRPPGADALHGFFQ
jgi:four helix bundle protein